MADNTSSTGGNSGKSTPTPTVPTASTPATVLVPMNKGGIKSPGGNWVNIKK